MSKYAIIDYRTNNEAANTLSNYFDKVIKINPLNVSECINGHPDLGVCKITDNMAVVALSLYEYLKKELPDIQIISGSSEPYGDYPNDVKYNAACGKNCAIHNFEYTDEIILSVIEQKFLRRINVRQGYSKCSICFINDDAVITEDEGIYKILINEGFDVLKIEKGDINLSGMNYGFFGGATGFIDNKLFLNGELKNHKSSKSILDFLKKNNTEIIELKRGPIEDIGTIICFDSKIKV